LPTAVAAGARPEPQGVPDRRLALAGDHDHRLWRHDERAARAEPRAADDDRERSPVGRHHQQRKPGGRGRRDLGLGASAFARDQERARASGRQDGHEHQQRQPSRHRYSAAFST
jgi:hypothetical protein